MQIATLIVRMAFLPASEKRWRSCILQTRVDSPVHEADPHRLGTGSMARGRFRDSTFVLVDYGGLALVPISHALYRERGYAPLLDDLPAKAKYEARLGIIDP